MKKQKMMFRNLFLLATVIAVFSVMYGCKQPDNGSAGTSEITVTVEKDSHVKEAPKNFKLAKNSVLGFTELKQKIPGLKFKTGYELGKICLEKASGREITDVFKHKFDKDTVIFIVSKTAGGSDEVKLIELKVDGTAKNIKDTIDCGKTKKKKIKVEVNVSPADAQVSFEPALEGDFWELEAGQNTLKITVKKGTASKVYTVNIEKVDSETPILKKLTVGAESKEGAAITSEMEFSVPDSAAEVAVAAETDPAGAKVTFSPELTGGKIQLTGDETTLKITVGEGSKKSQYTVTIKKIVPVKLVDVILISGGNKGGVKSKSSEEDTNRILAGQKDVTVELVGTKASIILISQTKTWKSCKINGKYIQIFPNPSLSIADIKLPAKGETLDITIEIEDSENIKEEIKFIIKRLNETADIPADILIIGNKNVIDDKDILKDIIDENKTPEFNSGEPSHLEVQCTEDVIKSVNINGTVCNVKTKNNEHNNKVWYAEHTITDIQPAGKNVTITMEPKDSENHHSVTWTFKLKYETPDPIDVYYELNGKNEYNLDSDFVEGLNDDTNPLLQVKGSFLNVRLSFETEIENIKINDDTISKDSLKKEGEEYLLLHSIPLDISEKQIQIIVNPLDKEIYSSKILKFRAKGDGTKEDIKPVFEEISEDVNLSQNNFINKLSDGSKPIYKTAASSANISITLSNYECAFLCKEVRINDEKIDITDEDVHGFIMHKVKKNIPVILDSPVDVKIEFIPNDGKANNLKWEFKVQGGGKKPGIPNNMIKRFKINGVGNVNNPLPKALTGHLIDGTNPLYQFDGKIAVVEVGAFDNNTIEKVVFKMDGIKKEEVIPVKSGYTAYSAEYSFGFTDTEEHNIELIIHSKNPKYSELTYYFKLKSSGKITPPQLLFIINDKIKKNGHHEVIGAETATLKVQAKEDIMLEVKIGEKNTDEQPCVIKKFTDSGSGKTIWEASRDIFLLDSSGNAVEKTFIIRVTPKNSTIYSEAVCEYKIVGIKIADDNAEFIFSSMGLPRVDSKVKWLSGFENNQYTNDYGAEAVSLKAYTMSSRATVKYRIVDMDDNSIAGQEEKTMTNKNGVHNSEEIILFTDKPTIIKAWVIAADGITKDTEKGVWHMVYNPVPLVWDYKDMPNGLDYTTKAYDTIEIEKGKVKDNKIYLVFAPWKEADGYTVNNSGLPAYQTPFENLGKAGDLNTYYKASIDVSTLLNNSATELEAVLKMKRNGIDCLTYKVKIKLKA